MSNKYEQSPNRACRVGYAAGFAAARDEAKDELARAVRTREAAIDYWKARALATEKGEGQ